MLGFWQMLMLSTAGAARRSGSPVLVGDLARHGDGLCADHVLYYGFGYAVAATSLGRPIRGMTAAWIGFVVCLPGTVIAAV